jgi:hypothetical protein
MGQSPKATMVVETDYYFVWSTHMKKKITVISNIKESYFYITGTPQLKYILTGQTFKRTILQENELDIKQVYLFSGDDSTTSPDDPQYLEDLAKCCFSLNERTKSRNYFRRCPVDFQIDMILFWRVIVR